MKRKFNDAIESYADFFRPQYDNQKIYFENCNNVELDLESAYNELVEEFSEYTYQWFLITYHYLYNKISCHIFHMLAMLIMDFSNQENEEKYHEFIYNLIHQFREMLNSINSLNYKLEICKLDHVEKKAIKHKKKLSEDNINTPNLQNDNEQRELLKAAKFFTNTHLPFQKQLVDQQTQIIDQQKQITDQQKQIGEQQKQIAFCMQLYSDFKDTQLIKTQEPIPSTKKHFKLFQS